jgi:hypothetical protein
MRTEDVALPQSPDPSMRQTALTEHGCFELLCLEQCVLLSETAGPFGEIGCSASALEPFLQQEAQIVPAVSPPPEFDVAYTFPVWNMDLLESKPSLQYLDLDFFGKRHPIARESQFTEDSMTENPHS